jgi:hypothetical protein
MPNLLDLQQKQLILIRRLKRAVGPEFQRLVDELAALQAELKRWGIPPDRSFRIR